MRSAASNIAGAARAFGSVFAGSGAKAGALRCGASGSRLPVLPRGVCAGGAMPSPAMVAAALAVGRSAARAGVGVGCAGGCADGIAASAAAADVAGTGSAGALTIGVTFAACPIARGKSRSAAGCPFGCGGAPSNAASISSALLAAVACEGNSSMPSPRPAWAGAPAKISMPSSMRSRNATEAFSPCASACIGAAAAVVATANVSASDASMATTG